MSLPILSVPKIYFQLGGLDLFAKSVKGPTCSGNGVIYGASKASDITIVTITNPITESGFRLYL